MPAPERTGPPRAAPSRARRTLRARLQIPAGLERPIEQVEVEWVSSHPELFSVEADPEDPLRATLTQKADRGTAIISARAKGRPRLLSDPVVVIAAELAPETVLVSDDRVVFPPPNVPAGADLSALGLPDLHFDTGSLVAGAFTESEIAALYHEPSESSGMRLGVELELGA